MATPTAVRALGYWAYQYKRTWRSSLVSSFLNPALFLAAMGFGLGSLIDEAGSASLGGVDYVVFLAPGLLAATCMQTSATESTFAVVGGIKWIRTYHGMLATPLSVGDIVVGHLAWIGLRLLQTAAIFTLVMTLFGAVDSAAVLVAVPAAALTGFAFTGAIAAFAAVTADNDGAFNPLFRFGIMPMYLFSGTFFPVTQLPAPLEALAYVTPLWHGVDLCRDIALGTITPLGDLGHVAYLCVWVVGGFVLAWRAFMKKLVI
ncbi:MAG: ABC transporter permease [Acidimicrobiales bacterium]